jgi:hypothetical protein
MFRFVNGRSKAVDINSMKVSLSGSGEPSAGIVEHVGVPTMVRHYRASGHDMLAL